MQVIDAATNELIGAYVDNYQSNSVDVTLSQTKPNIKVIILGACGGGGTDVAQEGTIVESAVSQINFTGPGVLVTNPSSGQVDVAIGTKNNVRSSDVITVSADYQYLVYGNLTVEGIVNNYGEVVILNGVLNISPGAQFNNLGLGLLKTINLATGDSMQVVVKTINATAGVPLTVNHALGTKDFTYNIRENDTFIDVDLVHIDTNNVQLTSLVNITGGTMVFHAKI